MGSDYSSHQLFCGDTPVEECRPALVAHLRQVLSAGGYREVATEGEADRCFVLGPHGRWLHLGDSTGSTEFADGDAFGALSLAVSTLVPVVDIEMSDDACLHLTLYRGGERVDRFGTGAFPFYPFESDAEAAEFRGKPEAWQELLLPAVPAAQLREAWDRLQSCAWRLLPEVAALFGWNPALASVGYTHDIEGLPERYDRYLADEEIDLSGFQESCFRRTANEREDGEPPVFADMEWDD